ncbi:hypothetical protein BDD12DRAFT_802698 [Trichophaea hybrida]|nr:hypothetical protein BDD12DRAFT_802698 [Trichophaea hybrida]
MEEQEAVNPNLPSPSPQPHHLSTKAMSQDPETPTPATMSLTTMMTTSTQSPNPVNRTSSSSALVLDEIEPVVPLSLAEQIDLSFRMIHRSLDRLEHTFDRFESRLTMGLDAFREGLERMDGRIVEAQREVEKKKVGESGDGKEGVVEEEGKEEGVAARKRTDGGEEDGKE